MAKKKEPFHKDSFVLVLLAVVFSAIAVIMLRAAGVDSLDRLTGVVRQQVKGAETPSQMLQELEKTKTETEFPEFDQLRDQTKGL